MIEDKPSLFRVTFFIVVATVSPTLVPVLTMIITKSHLLTVVALFFSLIVLLLVLPYSALVMKRISSQTWFKTYVQILSHISFARRIVQDVYHPFGLSVQQLQIQAEDWKELHKDLQDISHMLFILQGLVLPDDLDTTLHDLVTHWYSMMIEYRIRGFFDMGNLPDRTVKKEFMNTVERNKWLENLRSETEKMDEILSKCEVGGDLRHHIREVRATVNSLGRISSEMLRFLDGRLQKTIRELDTNIQEAMVSDS